MPINTTLVTACCRAGDLDSHDTPKFLVQLGAEPLIVHVLTSLWDAGISKAVIVVGFKGDKIIQVCKERSPPGLDLEFVDVGTELGHARSILATKDKFPEPFLISTCDHLFDKTIISEMATTELSPEKAGCVLVEEDLQGMTGLPTTAVQVDIEAGGVVKRIGRNLANYNALDAGLFAFTPDIFTYLQILADSKPYFSLADAMDLLAKESRLTWLGTNNRTWFAIETPTEFHLFKDHSAFTAQERERRSTAPHAEEFLLSHTTDVDGNQINVLPVGRAAKHLIDAPQAGGEWNEFSVDKWRSAVFTTKSFFQQLYVDTTQYVTSHIREMQQSGKTCLIEVGCGTGETTFSLMDAADYTIGFDFNATFVNFCSSNLPEDKKSHLAFHVGDAVNLADLVPQWIPDKTDWKRCIISVGNTMGIIPLALRGRVYQQMAEAAGTEGRCIVVYWNANCFGDACQNFYFKNPQLCGPFSGEHIDLATTTLKTPSGYHTHWTGPEEARELLTAMNLEVLDVQEKGKGVMIAFRKKAQGNTEFVYPPSWPVFQP